jgi:MFS transporter, YNFM family, putative membrane transport protein
LTSGGGERSGTGFVGFLLGSTGMFAVMYSTQAILPELSRDFHVRPSQAGLTLSVVVLALAVGAWAWGPLSDRWGRKNSLVLASSLVVLPTIAAGLAPSFGALLTFRALQGLCMPGLLTVGVPYVAETFATQLGARAMGYYMSSLVAGGVIGRVGVALLTDAVGWRWAVGGLAVLPAAGSVILRRSLPDLPRPARAREAGLRRQVTNLRVLRAAVVGSAFFFVFVGTFSYVTYRLERPPFDYGTVAGSAVFGLWVLGFTTPLVGRISDRFGWRRVAAVSVTLSVAGLLITLPSHIATLILGLAALALGNFAGVMAAQLGVSEATKVDRGSASAVFFSIYYACGALGGYVPGVVWQAWHWSGIVVLGVGTLLVAGAALVVSRQEPRSEGGLEGRPYEVL